MQRGIICYNVRTTPQLQLLPSILYQPLMNQNATLNKTKTNCEYTAMTIKISKEELSNLPDSSIAFKDGSGYIAELAVYHELHCIVFNQPPFP